MKNQNIFRLLFDKAIFDISGTAVCPRFVDGLGILIKRSQAPETPK